MIIACTAHSVLHVGTRTHWCPGRWRDDGSPGPGIYLSDLSTCVAISTCSSSMLCNCTSTLYIHSPLLPSSPPPSRLDRMSYKANYLHIKGPKVPHTIRLILWRTFKVNTCHFLHRKDALTCQPPNQATVPMRLYSGRLHLLCDYAWQQLQYWPRCTCCFDGRVAQFGEGDG